MKTRKISYITLLLMISFASVNAVMYTPALPNLAAFFGISANLAQQTVTGFLVGYALGQLIYGPLANRYGRKPALYMGILLQIISSGLCILAGLIHEYHLLFIGRILLAIGAGVGLKMSFTMVNESYEPKVASQKIAYLMLSFAITPGLSIALGGYLTAHLGWMSCFYAGMIYGIILLLAVTRLPETATTLDKQAFELKHLVAGYSKPFGNRQLLLGAMLMGLSTAIIYVFSALAPFIAMDLLGMSSATYGAANIIPAIALVIGSIASASMAKKHSLRWIIKIGIGIVVLGIIAMWVSLLTTKNPVFILFMPVFVIYLGLSLIFANTSALALSQVTDKAHGSAVMNFINIATAAMLVIISGKFTLTLSLLPSVYLGIGIALVLIYRLTRKNV
jgi:DHA1 family bicyclomycin/chloramphenicol resistance-like MFS transporter